MFTTGNKLLLGATGAAIVGSVLYGVTQSGTLGTIGLVFAAIALSMLAGANLYFRDSNVSAMDDEATLAGVAAAQGAPPRTPWPLVFAFGTVTVVVGLVSQQTFFVIGIIVLLAAGAEWLVEAWANRASADPAHVAEVRNRMANSLEYPLAGAVGVGALVFAFSRMMLWISKVGAVVIFSVMAVIIIAIAAAITAGGRKVPKSAVAAVLGIGAVAVVTGGAAAGIDGERHIHVYETIGMLAEEGDSEEVCLSTEKFEVDKKNSQSVALKSNQAARVTLTESDELLWGVPGAEALGEDALTIWRSNPTNIVFKNDSGKKRRLTLDLGTKTIVDEESGEESEVPNLICTPLVEEGGAQLLTVTVGIPSFAFDDGYALSVPGVDGPEIEVIVP